MILALYLVLTMITYPNLLLAIYNPDARLLNCRVGSPVLAVLSHYLPL